MAELRGTNGRDRREGTMGHDVISLLDGDDRGIGLRGNDTIYGNGGNDALFGNDGNDRLIGGVGFDELFGGDGNDILKGGPGADTLNGGNGADRFVYDALPASPYGAIENIRDFTFAEGDRIDLSAIDARPDIAGNQAFRFVSGNAFTGGKGEALTFYGTSGDLIIRFLQVDMDGDRYSDMTIGVQGPAGDIPAAGLIL